MTIQPEPNLSLYIHIPFCKTMCTYCAFNTYTGLETIIPRFVDAVAKEIAIVGESRHGTMIGTIFLGGGTPSLLSPQQLQHILQAVRMSFRIVTEPEISLEANPNDLSPIYLRRLHATGFNRLSIGMQTTTPRILDLFNREHDTTTVIQAVADAKAAGFDNISLDLIFGAPYQTLTDWEDTLQTAIDLQVQNISTYNLMLKGGTKLKQQVDNGELPQPDDDLDADMYELTTEMLCAAGFEQYEISNWSLPGFEAQHNLQYWRNLPYLGIGPGAHGYAGGIRYIVMRYPQRYIEVIENNQNRFKFPLTPAVSKSSVIDREAELSETIMMGLRMTREGIQRERFRRRFGEDITDRHQEAIAKHVQYGLLYVDDTVVRLTEKGRLVSNAVIRDLI